MKEEEVNKKCPKCESGKYIISIFGAICPDCFYDGEDFNCECKEPEPDKSIDSLGFGGRFERCKICGGRVWH